MSAIELAMREMKGISFMRAQRIRKCSVSAGVSARAIQMREARLEGMLIAIALIEGQHDRATC